MLGCRRLHMHMHTHMHMHMHMHTHMHMHMPALRLHRICTTLAPASAPAPAPAAGCYPTAPIVPQQTELTAGILARLHQAVLGPVFLWWSGLARPHPAPGLPPSPRPVSQRRGLHTYCMYHHIQHITPHLHAWLLPALPCHNSC